MALNARSRVIEWAEAIAAVAPGIVRLPLAGERLFTQFDVARDRAWFFGADKLVPGRAHHDQAE